MNYVERNYCNVRSFALSYYGPSFLAFPFGKQVPFRVLNYMNAVSGSRKTMRSCQALNHRRDDLDKIRERYATVGYQAINCGATELTESVAVVPALTLLNLTGLFITYMIATAAACFAFIIEFALHRR